jgi:signal transduction histidine kinase
VAGCTADYLPQRESPMKIPGWTAKSIRIPPSVKRDAVLLSALYLFNCFSFSAWLQLGQVATRPWLLLVWLYGLAMLVPLVCRDRAPVPVFVTQCVLTVAAWPIMPLYTPVVGIPVALYAVSVHCSKKISLLALLASFIPNGLAAAAQFKSFPTFTEGAHSFIPTAILLIVSAVGAWSAGRMTRASHQHVQNLEREREMAQREREMAREAEVRKAEVLVMERRRIARELHDIVSHTVTVMLWQAAGASCVAGTDFSQITHTKVTQIKHSLEHINATGTQTMAELRRLLSVLETGDPASHAVGMSELAPQPGLANLTELLTSLRATGMPITVHVEGTPRDLDPSVDLTAYRIVQEGLTNVLKHAGKDSNPRLRLVWDTQHLRIQIDNNVNLVKAHRGQALSIGRGLVGLHERAHAVGGDLHAEPHHEGGYRLTAILPFAIPATPPGISSTTVPPDFAQGHGDQGKVST